MVQYITPAFAACKRVAALAGRSSSQGRAGLASMTPASGAWHSSRSTSRACVADPQRRLNDRAAIADGLDDEVRCVSIDSCDMHGGHRTHMVPEELQTTRLKLRRWRRSDASELLPILEQNLEHLRHWIPERVYAPAPVSDLEERLAGYSSDFEAGKAWRFAMLSADSGELLGEISLFPRSAEGRVSIDVADRVEIGYWLRREATGCGFASEAVRALMDVAAGLQGIGTVEIRCDVRNAASAAVPRRLGFTPADPSAGGSKMVWYQTLRVRR